MGNSIIDSIIEVHPDKYLRSSVTDDPIIVYGAGLTAEYLCNYLEKHHVRIDAVVVDIPFISLLTDRRYRSYPVWSPDELAARYTKANIFVGFYKNNLAEYTSEKLRDFTSLGMSVTPHLLDVHLLMYPKRVFPYSWVLQHASAFQRFHDHLADNLSKRTLRAYINQRISMRIGPLESVRIPDQYFNESVIRLSGEEVYVDCGAYDGDSLREFFLALERHNGRVAYNHIYALEPNPSSFEKLKCNYASTTGVSLMPVGAWKRRAKLQFAGDRLRSCAIDAAGKDVIDVAPLDELLKGASPTYIKFDIEGAELEALHGGKEILSRHKPRLAICIYHRNDDMLTIPDLIDSLKCGYKLFLRAHESKSGEVVLYCIPQ